MITNEPGSIAGEPTSSRQLADALGYPLARTVQLLDRLADAGLIRCDAYGRWRSGHTTLDRAADRLGVAGILDQRAARYRLEREAWAWWRGELGRRAPPPAAQRRPPDPPPRPVLPPVPRGPR